MENGVNFTHPEFVEIDDNVTINSHVWFSIMPIMGDGNAPSLKIGKGTYIGRFVQISCVNRIIIENDVLISDRVFICDSLHGYSEINLPVSRQPLYSPGSVEIGSGTWVGIGVAILPNVKIGKNCVIGANTVVTRDIPDYHVAVGIPAHIVGRVDRCRG
jgi:acetyltransferase-like isoleucine patch superfamily enzyme